MRDAITALGAPPELETAARRIAAGLLCLPRRPETRDAAAEHEAAHAVVAAAEGLAVRSVRVYQRGGCWGGFTAWENCPPLTPEGGPGPYLLAARLAVAGWVGEGGSPGACADEQAATFVLVDSAARLSGRGAEELFELQVTLVKVTLLAYTDVHEAITAALMRQKRLSGARLSALLRPITKNKGPI